jgi:hypothetical protein
MAASSALAAAGFKIVVLLSAGSFQAVLPSAGPSPSPVFPDSEAGVGHFVEWLQPRLPRDAWNPPPRQFCVVGARPFDDAHPPYLPQPLYNSRGPLHGLEPYVANFHYVKPAQARPGATQRSLRQALQLCGIR